MLDQLDELKTKFGPGEAKKLAALLRRLSQHKFRDTESLIRYHELLLFLRTYPHNATILRAAEKELNGFAKRAEWLSEQDIDISPLEHPEVSGIAGTPVTDTFSFYIVRWLMKHYPAQMSIYWDWFEDENRLGATWPRFIPLLTEDTFVEANIPYREWLKVVRGGRPELAAPAPLPSGGCAVDEVLPSCRGIAVGVRRGVQRVGHGEPARLLARRTGERRAGGADDGRDPPVAASAGSRVQLAILTRSFV